jgi:osmotically-inducible protein OsmY
MYLTAVFRILLLAAAAVSLQACVGVSLDPGERPFSKAVDDLNTKAELNARLLSESAKLYGNVSTSVIEGRVHLAGNVPTDEERLKATEIAWATPNVVEVVNDIEVLERASITDVARDRWISTKVRAQILSDNSIRDVNYTIDTQNRVVFILGIAQDRAELERVIKHARSVENVERVVSYAVLKDDPRRFASPSARYGEAPDQVTPPGNP